MKKIIGLSLMVILAVSCQWKKETPSAAAEPLPWLTDYTAAVESAKKEKKPLLIEFSTEWCPYCQYMKEMVFSEALVQEKLEEYVLVTLNGDMPEMQAKMEEFKVNGFPTYIFLGTDGKERSRFNTASSAEDMLEKLKGDKKDFYSVRVNIQWRIVFKWKDGDVEEVKIIDYHRG